MNSVNRITICKDRYKTQDDFENAIKRAVMLLLENNYIMTIKYDEPALGIVCIDYNYADRSFGAEYPIWLNSEEQEKVF